MQDMQQHHQTSGCTTNMTTHLRRYHPQLLSSGSMQAKSTPKPPSTDQAAASTASGVTQPASQQRRQQTLWSQTHQLEQSVSADSVEPETSATPPQLPAVSLAAEETPVESVKVDQLLEDRRATKTPTCLLDTLLTDIYVTHMEPVIRIRNCPKKQGMALPVEWRNKTARSPDCVASIVIASRLPYHHFMVAAVG